jgi:hypothetical protein
MPNTAIEQCCQMCGKVRRQDDYFCNRVAGELACDECLEIAMENSKPYCVVGESCYYGVPVQVIKAHSGYKNEARVSVYQLVSGYTAVSDYDVYMVGQKVGKYPPLNCAVFKSVTEALEAGINEIHLGVEKLIPSYPHKVTEIRSLTKQLKGKLTVDIFE